MSYKNITEINAWVEWLYLYEHNYPLSNIIPVAESGVKGCLIPLDFNFQFDHLTCMAII